MEEGWGKRILRLITPLLIYEGMSFIVELIMSAVWAVRHMDSFVSSANVLDQQALINGLLKFTVKYALLMQGLAALASLFFLYRMYIKDYLKRRYVFDKSSVKRQMWLLLIPTGIFASAAGNCFLNIGSWAQNSDAFTTSESMLFSGPFIFQLIFIGLVIPVCEELIFRGLIYMRMRQYANVNVAIVMSAMIFAVMHGNLVQGIYAFVIGILFAYIYEKYGSLFAPIVLHVCANMLSLAIGRMGDLDIAVSRTAFLVCCGAVSLAVTMILVFFIDRHVDADRIYLNAADNPSGGNLQTGGSADDGK